MIFDDFHRKMFYNIFFRYQALKFVYAYQISWWYSQNMYRGKTPQNFAFLFMDFTDFACFGHGLESFLKGPSCSSSSNSGKWHTKHHAPKMADY